MKRITWLIVSITFFWVTPVHADEDLLEFGPMPTWHLLGGLDTGGSFGSPGGGGYLGLELSISRLKQRAWYGVFADAAYDFGHEATTLYIGPELGYGFVGFDGGFAYRIPNSGENDFGPHGRFMLTLGVFSLYARYSRFVETRDDVAQVGVLIKMPLWASKGRR